MTKVNVVFGRVWIYKVCGPNNVCCRVCKKNFCWLRLEVTGDENESHFAKYKHWTDITKKNKCKLNGDMIIEDMENGSKKNWNKQVVLSVRLITQ